MKIQIAKILFHTNLSIMKKILDLIAFKINRDTNDFKYAKRQVMDYFYENLKQLFKVLVNEKVIKKCKCNHDLRQGWSTCPDCGGSGYINFDD